MRTLLSTLAWVCWALPAVAQFPAFDPAARVPDSLEDAIEAPPLDTSKGSRSLPEEPFAIPPDTSVFGELSAAVDESVASSSPLAFRPMATRWGSAKGENPRSQPFGEYVPEAERQWYGTRLYAGLGAAAVIDGGAMLALSTLWYESERVPFHWYSESVNALDHSWLDDWNTYVQMDKGGHLIASYEIARMVGEYGRWSGLSDARAAWLGVGVSVLFQSQIELFDGRDAEYGASRTDLLANMVGAGVGGLKVAFPQKTAWFDLKISYAPSKYYDESISSFMPARAVGNFIKDYEGLTYWAALHPSKLGAPHGWPSWLGIAAGYGGKHLAHPISGVGPGGPEENTHVRQVYLSLDFDLFRRMRPHVPTWLRPVTLLLEDWHLPAPAVEFSSEGVKLHLLHF